MTGQNKRKHKMEIQFTQFKKLFKKQAVLSLFGCLAVIIAAAILTFADIFEFYIDQHTLFNKFSLYSYARGAGLYFLFFLVFYGARGIFNYIHLLNIDDYTVARCAKIFKRRKKPVNKDSKRRFWFMKISFSDVFDTTLFLCIYYLLILIELVWMTNDAKSIHYKELCKCDYSLIATIGLICFAVFICYDVYKIVTLRKTLKEVLQHNDLDAELVTSIDKKQKEI